jgi:hypothetical protein
MKPAVLHDLKTERTDIGQPLPAALRALPFIFFASIAGAIGLSTYSFIQMKMAQQKQAEAQSKEQGEQNEITNLKREVEAVEAEFNNARQVQGWLNATNQIQPIVLSVCRSIEADASLTSLTLTRREEMPSQIQLAVQLNSPNRTRQVETIRTKLQDLLNYRTFSEQIDNNSKTASEMNFSCVLVKADSPDANP